MRAPFSTRSVATLLVVFVPIIAGAAAACGPAAPAPPQASVTAAPPAPTDGPATTPPAGDGTTTKVDLDAIFPPGPGRELVLENCQNCHTFVPIVILQMDDAGWTRNSVDHRPRVTGLSDAEFQTLYGYLKATFNPQRPVPVLPPALLETWTGY